MTDRIKNILIGLFVLGAIAIMVSLVLFLKPTVGDGKKILNVRFTNISGIGVGTRVTFAGKPIGEVIHIRELPKARDEADDHGRIYLYQLTLKVDSSVDVFSNDEIAIKTTGLMGEKSIAILPKASTPSKPAHLITDQIVYANSTDALEHTFNQVAHAANQLETAVHRLDTWFLENQAYVTNALRSFDGAMNQVDKLLGSVDQEKLVPALKESVDLLSGNMQLIKSSLEDDQLLNKIASLAESLDQAAAAFNSDGAQALANINQISRDIASGSGTVGRLIVGDDFYLRLASLMNKGETLMNDVNHYGLLFQYNKQWQKSRTRKANFLKALDSPQEFRNYFEGEVDSMTTSLGRLSELMDRAGADQKTQIIQSDAFKHHFANLMRQVQGLTDALKLYNEGLVAESEGIVQE
ncbi:MAG: MlaD family protein [Parachlamydiales bacterium]|nr:MlaD family protein [Parachlamydiales bacterium]